VFSFQQSQPIAMGDKGFLEGKHRKLQAIDAEIQLEFLSFTTLSSNIRNN
jgi:hypothetical protein